MRKYAIAATVIPAMLIGATYAYGGFGAGASASSDTATDPHEFTRPEIASIASAYESAFSAEPVVIEVNGATIELDPSSLAIDVDEPSLAAEIAALAASPDGASITEQLAAIDTTGDLPDIPVDATLDETALASMLSRASNDAIDNPPVNGALRIANGTVTPLYPKEGLRVDVEAALPLVRDTVLSLHRSPVEVPVVTAAPSITRADVEAAIATADRLTQSDIVLKDSNGDGEIVFTRDDLRKALRSRNVDDPVPGIEVYLDRSTISRIARTYADDFDTPPKNATFSFSRTANNLVVVPSVPGQSLDVARAVDLVLAKAAGGLRSGIIPTIDGVEADFTTKDAQALGPFSKVSSFTTKHPCCKNRVTNIHLIADATNGALVMPGQTFSLNARVGRRTEAKGYKRAGAIIGGKVVCCDSPINVGGGTSQFATTLWNAIFFGCYQDVFHQPHSIYFSRYPYVREATLGYPSPDVKFRNDSSAPVYIRATYTGTSITVSLYGNNGGRKCTSSTSGNTVTRTMQWPNGKVTRQHWTWHYRDPVKDEPTTTPHAAPTTTKAKTTTTTTATTTTTSVAPTTTTTAAPTTTTTSEAPTTTPTAAPTTTTTQP